MQLASEASEAAWRSATSASVNVDTWSTLAFSLGANWVQHWKHEPSAGTMRTAPGRGLKAFRALGLQCNRNAIPMWVKPSVSKLRNPRSAAFREPEKSICARRRRLERQVSSYLACARLSHRLIRQSSLSVGFLPQALHTSQRQRNRRREQRARLTTPRPHRWRVRLQSARNRKNRERFMQLDCGFCRSYPVEGVGARGRAGAGATNGETGALDRRVNH